MTIWASAAISQRKTNIIPNMLKDLPDYLIGIVIVLVLSASMSTLSSLVLASSSTLTLDFIAPMKKKKMQRFSMHTLESRLLKARLRQTIC